MRHFAIVEQRPRLAEDGDLQLDLSGRPQEVGDEGVGDALELASSSPVVTATWLSRNPRSMRSRSVTRPRKLVEMTAAAAAPRTPG